MENEELQFNLSKIRLIIGLGNIGREYDQTRHNVGFDFVDFLGGTLRFGEESKLKSLLLSAEVDGNRTLLAKPTTMMNMSGESVSLILKYYNIENDELLVVHDDLDLMLGKYKIQFAKGPKVHNGITSIENRLGTNKFWRLRIGIDNRDASTRDSVPGANYVLARFKQDEQETIDKVFEDVNENWNNTTQSSGD